MKAEDIMTTDVVSVARDTSVHDAATLLAEHNISSMPVTDDNGRVIGMVAEIDLIRNRMPHDPRAHLRGTEYDELPDPAQTVGEVMSDFAVCLGRSADVADLAELMLDNNVRAIPIVDGAKLVGIVSRRDLVRTLMRDDAQIAAEVRNRLDDFSGSPGQWPVTVHDGVVRIDGRFADPQQHDIAVLLARTVPGVIRVHTHRYRWG